MTTSVKLLSASVHYPPDLILHTASSGRVAALDELYLIVERNRDIEAFGEIRENVAYLTGLEPAKVRAAVIGLANMLDWSADPAAIYDSLLGLESTAPAVARALLDSTLVDWVARQCSIPVSELFEAQFQPSHTTNQSLFISEDRQLLAMAERYIERGFRKLKVRVGARGFTADLRRISMLRDRFGAEVEIAIDANGRWTLDDALHHLESLSPYTIAYAEQPIAAGDWNALRELSERSPIPIMLDESVSTTDDVTRIIDGGGRLWAHLKVVKLGGITPTIKAARQLVAADIPFMIGQMNEGAGATAAAYHCAIATSPVHAELYGADGLVDDPVKGVSYINGYVSIKRAPGLGVSIEPAKLHLIWEAHA
jgi:L-alanine-DL-glutamate epimerase-like enolase superfamily enzyme